VTAIHRAAVIPTRNRHDLLADCINSVIDQVDRVIVIDNLSDPPIDPEPWHGKVGVAAVPIDPPNISQLWNIGLSLAANAAEAARNPDDFTEFDVAVLNSDVIVPPGWVHALSTAMRATPAVLAYPDQHGGTALRLHTRPEPIDLRQRITGYAYLLRGEMGLRLDESMAWWYSDDDLDWRARASGGALLVPGHPVEHRAPNGSMYERPELHDQALRDRTTFITKWGKAPH
jgi:GT2 family glycosyltransferase